MNSRSTILLLLVSLLLMAPEAVAQQVTLKATLQAATTHPFYGVSMVRLKEEIEKRSGGAIAIQIFDKSQLAQDKEVVDAVSSGVADIGTTATHNYAKKAPAISFLDLPFLFNFKALMAAAARPGGEIRQLIDNAILTQGGLRVLFWQGMGDTVFYSKGGRDVADVAHLKGQRVAVPGTALEAFVAHCGGMPVALTVEKFHDGLKGGMLDMAMVTAPAVKSLRLWGVTDTMTFTGHSPVEFIFVINEKVWQSLAPHHRTAIAEAASHVEVEARERVARLEVEAARFAAENGFKFQDLTPDQVTEWRACSAEMLADYMDNNGELARRLMAAYARLRTDPCCTAGPTSTVAFTRR